MYPKYTAPLRPAQYHPRGIPRNVLTVSGQYVGERTVFPTPPIDLYRSHECHHNYNEIEDRDTAPGHRQT